MGQFCGDASHLAMLWMHLLKGSLLVSSSAAIVIPGAPNSHSIINEKCALCFTVNKLNGMP